MGLDFLRDKAKRFTQQRDESKQKELDVAELLGRGKSDVVVHVFHCLLTDESTRLESGSALVLKVDSDCHVSLLQHARKIGEVVPEEIADLLRSMKANHHLGGVLSVTVAERPAIDGVFTVRPKTPFKN